MKNSSAPVEVSGLAGVGTIAAMHNFNMATAPGEAVWVWGSNDHMQFGEEGKPAKIWPAEGKGAAGLTTATTGLGKSMPASAGPNSGASGAPPLGGAKTVKGQVWPMANDPCDLGEGFLAQHAVVVELRESIAVPAAAGLGTTAALLSDYSPFGEFAIENVPCGTYVLHIRRPGFLARAMALTVSPPGPDVIELEPQPLAPDTEDGAYRLWWGDSNGDNQVAYDDLTMIYDFLDSHGGYVDAFDPWYVAAFDFNADGLIGSMDFMYLMQTLGKDVSSYTGAEDVDFGDGPAGPSAQVSIDAVNEKTYDVSVAASGISSFNGMEIKVLYDPAVFEVADLCAYTRAKETSTGAIAAAGITVTHASPGEARFTISKAIPSGQQWGGALTTIKFKAKAAATSAVNVTFQ